jgi:hypothetical protein
MCSRDGRWPRTRGLTALPYRLFNNHAPWEYKPNFPPLPVARPVGWIAFFFWRAHCLQTGAAAASYCYYRHATKVVTGRDRVKASVGKQTSVGAKNSSSDTLFYDDNNCFKLICDRGRRTTERQPRADGR